MSTSKFRHRNREQASIVDKSEPFQAPSRLPPPQLHSSPRLGPTSHLQNVPQHEIMPANPPHSVQSLPVDGPTSPFAQSPFMLQNIDNPYPLFQNRSSSTPLSYSSSFPTIQSQSALQNQNGFGEDKQNVFNSNIDPSIVEHQTAADSSNLGILSMPLNFLASFPLPNLPRRLSKLDELEHMHKMLRETLSNITNSRAAAIASLQETYKVQELASTEDYSKLYLSSPGHASQFSVQSHSISNQSAASSLDAPTSRTPSEVNAAIQYAIAEETSPLPPTQSIAEHSARLRSASLERQQRRIREITPSSRSKQNALKPPDSSASRRGRSRNREDTAQEADLHPSNPIESSLLMQSLMELMAHLQHPTYGIKSEDRRWRLTLFKKCFTGSTLVDWMLANGWSNSRAEAVQLGNLLVDHSLLVHVSSKSFTFEDNQTPYRLADPSLKIEHKWRFTPFVNSHALFLPTVKPQSQIPLSLSPPTTSPTSSQSSSSHAQYPQPTLTNMLHLLDSGADESQKRIGLQQLRQSVLYFCSHANRQWNLSDDSGQGIRQFTIEKIFQHSNANVDNFSSPHSTGSSSISIVKPVNHISNTISSNSSSIRSSSRYPKGSTPDDSSSDVPEGSYVSRAIKTVSPIKCSCEDYMEQLLDFRTRKRWEPLFVEGHEIETLSQCTRLNYIKTTSPISSIAPRDAVSFQDYFVDSGIHVLYEISIDHTSTPPTNEAIRAQVMLLARIARPLPHDKNVAELTLVHQIDFMDPDKSMLSPEWLIAEWAGQRNDISLSIPTDITPISPSPSLLLSSSPFSSLRPSASFSVSPTSSNFLHLDSKSKSSSGAYNNQLRSYNPIATGSTHLVKSSPSPRSFMPMYNESNNNTNNNLPSVTEVNSMPSFTPLAVLGRGAYSKIMQVADAQTGMVYAMKVLRKSDVTKSHQEGHVVVEQSILSQMDYPFVCRLYYAFQSKDKLYMVMSYAAGGDLFTLLRRQALSEEGIALYAAELVLALRYIHSHGIIHRDLKPENILIMDDGHLLLVDFGLSVEQTTPNSRTYSVSGTSEYLAPEMITNSGHDENVDWWQLGIILCEMFTGKHPFYHRNLYRMQQNIIHRIPLFESRMSNEARSLVNRLLEKNPYKRLGRSRPGDVLADGSISPGDIESHPFFEKYAIRWQDVERKLYKPPWVPHLTDVADVSNFDSAYTSELPLDTPNSSFNDSMAPPSLIVNSPLNHNLNHLVTSSNSQIVNNPDDPSSLERRQIHAWEQNRGFHGGGSGALPLRGNKNVDESAYNNDESFTTQDLSVLGGYANYLHNFSTK